MMMIFVAMKPSTALLLFTVVGLLIRTSVAALSTISMPPSLPIDKVQESIRLAALKKVDTIVHTKLDNFLNEMVSHFTENSPSSKEEQEAGLSESGMDNKNEVPVVVDALGQTSDGTTLESVLMENGYQVINCYMNKCSLYVSADQLEGLTKIPEILKINLALSASNNDRHSEVTLQALHDSEGRDLQGSVLSQAVRAMFVDTARSRYTKINGTGITIGILSDSFDCRGTQAIIDVQTGDLPPLSRINVLADINTTTDPSCSDEGRAMMQLVYDIAPGANFAFHTANRGQADFAAGIIALADAGCQIIVDDVYYFAAPFFQDGIIAIAVNEVASRGVYYFTSAGNRANRAWDGTKGFIDSAIKVAGTNATYHSYGLDTNGSHVILQPFRTTKRRSTFFIMNWDEPFISPKGNGGSRSDIDVYIFDDTGKILYSAVLNDIGSNPYEIFSFDTSNVTTAAFSTAVVVYVAIALDGGPPPTYMKIMSVESGTFAFSTGTEATSFGHKNSASAASVGAADYIDTPAFGVSPPVVETFSSYGGTPIFFDAESNRLPVREIRQQPRFTGPDGVSTTFFSGPSRTFFGTSASAPNVAGVAALMLQLHSANNIRRIAPNDFFKILESTAIDMTSTIGFDFRTGYGFINASAALDAVSLLKSTKTPSKTPTNAPIAPIVVPVPIKTPINVPFTTKSPAKVSSTKPVAASPTAAPVNPPTNCGLFGLNFLCLPRGECGFFRRLFNINGC